MPAIVMRFVSMFILVAAGGSLVAVPLHAAGDPCTALAAQSPIPLLPPGTAEETAAMIRPPEVRYGPTAVTLWNKAGKELEVQYSPGGSNYILLDGVRFDLQQLHLHRPGEHPIRDQVAPMELHLVHANASGGLAVLGVPITIGGDGKSALDRLLRSVPEGTGWRQLDPVELDASTLLPAGSSLVARYPGSLTSEPYTECVSWNVLTTAVQISQESFDQYEKRFPNPNARGVQPLNGRQPVLLRFP